MKNLFKHIILILLLFTLVKLNAQCIYVVNLYDSYGDGWTNFKEYAYIKVYVNSSYIGYIDVPDGDNSASYNISLNNNDLIQFSYVTNGSYDSEHSFEVIDPWNNVVASGGNSMPHVNQGVASFYVHCTVPSGGASLGNDCGWAPTVCSDDNIVANSTGPGNVYELNLSNEGTLFDEHQSSWFYFHAQSTGTIELTIAPNSSSDIYDFAIWDNKNCSPTSTPIRSSWASLTGNTGLIIGAGDNSEGNSGDKWLNELNANQGDEYLILVDNWSYSTNGFTLYWQLSSGSSLDCEPLPIKLKTFYHNCSENTLYWETATEINDDYFTIQKSYNSIDWQDIGMVNGNGNSNSNILYSYKLNSKNDKAYYRLTQTDFDGKTEILNSIAVSCDENSEVLLYPNPTKNKVNIYGKYSNIEVYNTFGVKIKIEIINNIIVNLEKGFYIIIIDKNKKIKLVVE